MSVHNVPLLAGRLRGGAERPGEQTHLGSCAREVRHVPVAQQEVRRVGALQVQRVDVEVPGPSLRGRRQRDAASAPSYSLMPHTLGLPPATP